METIYNLEKSTSMYKCKESYCGNVNTRRMSKPDMGSIFHMKNQWNILGIENFYVKYQNYQNLSF